ncbi:MAG: dihydrodipicolinate synthase family protein, partial [Rhizobium sp.]|nr:dihydrodipicolinate synthase family protein [Rhizobium sp.]
MTMQDLHQRFNGVFTALVTPFKDGAIDTAAYDALVERQIEAGVAGLVPVGTTGEAATLSDEEAEALIAR